MPHMIILRGLPGSGKTTWAREFIRENPEYKRICKDDLRAMFDDGMYSFMNEQFIRDAQEDLVRCAHAARKNIILDDTNIRAEAVISLTALGLSAGYSVDVRDFDTPLEECIARDAQRARPVGENRIREMHQQMIKVQRRSQQ